MQRWMRFIGPFTLMAMQRFQTLLVTSPTRAKCRRDIAQPKRQRLVSGSIP
jgi:hypothetical protein